MFCFFDFSKKLVLTRGGGEIVREEIHSADDRHHTQERRGPRSQHGIYTDENFIYFPKNKSGKKHGCKLRRIARLTIAICLITRLTIQKWLIIKVFLTRDSSRGRVTWVWSITFMTQLLLSLGLDIVLFASSKNFESGPRFPGVCTGVTYFPVCEKN